LSGTGCFDERTGMFYSMLNTGLMMDAVTVRYEATGDVQRASGGEFAE